jgi:hypothetical protein
MTIMVGGKRLPGESYTTKQNISGDAYGVDISGATPGSLINTSGLLIQASAARSVGVNLASGGTVTNQVKGVIRGAGTGVQIFGGAGHVMNYGAILGPGDGGVYFFDGGTVTNFAAGEIQGGNGLHGTGAVIIHGGLGTVVNAGDIFTSQGRYAVDLDAGGKVINAGTIANYVTSALYLGVFLPDGGTVANHAGGTILAPGPSIAVEIGRGTIVNAGVLESKHDAGVTLQAGGSVTNEAHATISAVDNAVSSVLGQCSVTNAGSIKSSAEAGVDLTGVEALTPCEVTNTGSITGKVVGVTVGFIAAVDPPEVTNAGSIRGGTGVNLPAGGKVINKSGAKIAGVNTGVVVSKGGSVIDAGEIDGAATSSGASVEFFGAGPFSLTLQNGASLHGAARGSTLKGAANRLYMFGAGEAEDGFVNFTTMSVQASGTWTIGGASTIGKSTISTGALDLAGELTTQLAELKGATLTFAAGGKLTLKGSSVLSGSVTGTGTTDISAGASATLYGKVSAGDTFTYAGAEADLTLNDLYVSGAQWFHGKIAGFASGDNLDAGAPFGAGTTLHFTENAGHTAGLLTLTHGTIHASLTLLGSYSASDFHIASDGHGGSLILHA